MIEPQTFPGNVYILIRQKRQCPTCSHEIPQFDTVVTTGHVQCWTVGPNYLTVEVMYGDYDVLLLEPEKVWTVREEAEVAAALEQAVPRYWFTDPELGFVEVVPFEGRYVSRCNMWVHDPVDAPLTFEQACKHAQESAKENRYI